MTAFRPTPDALLPELDPACEIVLLARTLWHEGYDDHLAGHITYNLGDGTFLCNPWYVLWNELLPDDAIRIDLDGAVVEGDWPVPPGIPLHLELHREREDVGVALHNHPRWGTIWADAGRVPRCYDQSSALGGGEIVVVNEYTGPVNQRESARAAVQAMGGADTALLMGHGVFVTGNGIRAVHQRAVALEHRCRTAWHVEALGSGTELPANVRARFASGAGDSFIGFWEAMARAELARDPALHAAVNAFSGRAGSAARTA